MQTLIYSEDSSKARIAVLIKEASFARDYIYSFYVAPSGLDAEMFAAISLFYDSKNKITAKDGKAYVLDMLRKLEETNIEVLLVADTNYFKYLTGKQNTTNLRGKAVPCNIVGFEHIEVVLSVNYHAIIHNPQYKDELEYSLTYLTAKYGGGIELGSNIIHSAKYPDTLKEIKEMFAFLHKKKTLAADIEGLSLRFEKCGIATIGFAWSRHDGCAFKVAWRTDEGAERLALLKEFLETYQGDLYFHNILFEIKVFVYELFMEHDTDWEGMRRGTNLIAKYDDTMFKLYLCTNNTIQNKLSLKEAAYEYTGGYAIDVTDINQHDTPTVLEYNLKDCLATYYLIEKFSPMLIQEEQDEYYHHRMKPFVAPAARMMLTGLPMDMDKVNAANNQIIRTISRLKQKISSNQHVKKAVHLLARKRWKKKNSELKKKIRPLSDFYEPFNPNSDQQLGVLLYDVLKLPILDTTDSGAGSTSAKVLKRLLDHEDAKPHAKLLNLLMDFSSAAIVESTFISTFLELAFQRKSPDPVFDGTYWLNGNLKPTGTKSGRLSSSEPNMQNIPSGSFYGKLIKSCFVAPKGWLFAGADFNALEDRINSLRTQDPNKIRVYSDGYDGHCLRAFAYFGDQMTGVPSVDEPKAFNEYIKTVYDSLRSKSKSPTFAMTYGGTYHTLMKNLGFSEQQAREIEARYQELYKVSIQYAEEVTARAAAVGYVELAFGLKLRCPTLARARQTRFLKGSEAAESRTVNNADSQSYGQLMNRAIMAFEKRLEQSEFVNDVLLMNTIHDAVYLLIRDDPKVVKWVNDVLIEEMGWNEDPSIKSDIIPMTAELDIGLSWDKPTTLKNHLSEEEIAEQMALNGLCESFFWYHAESDCVGFELGVWDEFAEGNQYVDWIDTQQYINFKERGAINAYPPEEEESKN